MIFVEGDKKIAFINNKFYRDKIYIRELRHVLSKKISYRKHARRRNNQFQNLYTNFFGKNSFLYNTSWGAYSACNKNCHIIDTMVGKFSAIGWNVSIAPREHQYRNFTIEDFAYIDNQHYKWKGAFGEYNVKIGHDVWVGSNTTILSGVEIGNGAIIAAGSIVNKSVPPYAIVGGNPIRFIKWRFCEDVVRKLQETNWYDWELNDIVEKREELAKIVGYDLENPYIHVFERKPDICEQKNII